MKYGKTILRKQALALFAVLAVAGAAGWWLDASSARASGDLQGARLHEAATKAVEAWAHAVASGNVETVRKILAPEYQILRSDGRGYDAAQYLDGGMSKIASIVDVKDIVATAHGELMVVRWVITLKASADGEKMQRTAPRLTVFRRDGERWLVVAHANFAHLEK